MMSNFKSYLQGVAESIARENGPRLQELISVSSAAAQQAVMAARTSNPRWNPAAACNRLPEGWAEFMAFHCACLAALQEGSRADAYDKAVSAAQSFVRVFREDGGDWVVHPMHSVTHNLRAVAEAADAEQRAAGRRPDRLADCGAQLRNCFSASLQAPLNPGKKLAALDIVNVSIKLYFRLNTLRLCKSVMNLVPTRQFAPFESFPAAQRVTYRFYEGRLAIFNENYQEASECLAYALRHCHRSAHRNQARCLKYLVPVALLMGRLPSAALVQRYKEVLDPYSPLIAALRTGDVGLFDSTMVAQQTAFIRDGTYLLLEKLRAPVLRRLLRRVAAIWAGRKPEEASRIPLALFQDALRVLGCDLDMDEVECVAANLIYRKYVKGYIHHAQKIMVVAKANAFPPLSAAMHTEA